MSGCGSAWLECLSGGQEAVGSNPIIPINKFKIIGVAMQKLKSYKLYLLLFAMFFLSFNNFITSLLVFVAIDILLATYVLLTSKKKSQKFITLLGYGCLLPVQIWYSLSVTNRHLEYTLERISTLGVTYLLLVLSFSLYAYLNEVNERDYFFSTTRPSELLYFSRIAQFNRFLADKKEFVNKSTKILNREVIEEVLQEVARNNSFSYINKGTLTQEYFQLLNSTLDDPYVYIVISDTGSATSQMLSLISHKNFNHVSISFDRDLQTLVSYNGGERVNPPGLNAEMIEYLIKKDDASIYVYKLPVTREQKEIMISKIDEINQDGSAYNLLGLFVRKSYKPNIMYCSHFVYTLLQQADLAYFDKRPHDVRPTDFVELDYERIVELEYKIKFNDL